ncbi:hypothetical protein EJ04DRAFT_469981 [Polyplosphaeria fusca]|uniref:Nephrocystin 3-like N-terminal domain-containing protein n=1 Tax=Polyplosphaeria fusca TaxID=682080 RepID=A0A9P4QW12_9PLEO|nr:hypothetical protein EJ04DRAFT_469981 [Polyplosphaeria fusca]
MKSLPAVGLASSILQIIDFGVKITQKDHKLFHPSEGESVENHVVLQCIANHLNALSSELDENDLKKLTAEKKGPKLSEAAAQLLKLSDETKEQTTALIDAVLQAQSRGSYSDPKWQTGREALLSAWKKKDLKTLKKKLKQIRKEVDTSLLVALRQYLDQSAETGLPVFSEDTPHLHHVEKWQNSAMDAVHTNKWKPNKKKDVEEFHKHTDALVLAETEARFAQETFAKLYFPVLDDRIQSIPAAFEGTFEWLFESSATAGATGADEANFMQWLANKGGHNLFWITGKVGSGKSVLMKHLFRNPRIFPSLEAWSGASPGITAGFFFWNSGTELQKTPAGLLRSLLYEALQDMIFGPLEQDPAILQLLFSDRWQQFLSYGGGISEFTLKDVRQSFDLMIQDASKKFLFIIDGLDEQEGYPDAVMDVLLSASKRDNVKICISSRQSPAYQNAFENRPCLTIDLKTNDDIQKYATSALHKNEQYAKLREQQSDDKMENFLVRELVHKASGVFLWACFATEVLLLELTEEGFSSLQSRLDALPSNLDGILNQIFTSLDETDRKKAARVFRIVNAHGYPRLLSLSFACDPRTESSLSAKIQPLTEPELTTHIAEMMHTLQNQTRNFLSIYEIAPDSPDSDTDSTSSADSLAAKPEHLKVNYRHRAVQDFIESEPIWKQICAFPLNPDEHWANASLWALKKLAPKDPLRIWDPLAWCIEYALRLEDADGKVRLTYLDEVARTFGELVQGRTTDLPDAAAAAAKPESFLDVAVWLNLAGYVRIRAKEAERKEVRHAIDYCAAVGKKLGRGGEAGWVGERRRLKVVYVRTTPELDQLLEYYSKPAMSRMVTAKPHVEIPESV